MKIQDTRRNLKRVFCGEIKHQPGSYARRADFKKFQNQTVWIIIFSNTQQATPFSFSGESC